MKPSKVDIARLAQLVRKDLARGRLSAKVRRAVESLLEYPAVVLDLLDLALAEAAGGRAKEPVFAT